MTYRGHVKQGVVVLDGNISLPEGTEVAVEPVVTTGQQSVWNNLLKVAGRAQGLPEDAAENVDHYLYGTPKK